MKNCAMCGTEREDVTAVQVGPATWNGFNNFAEVCEDCRATTRFQTGVKAGTAKRAKAKKEAEAAEAAAAEAPAGAPAGETIRILHRRTGALLHVFEGSTLANSTLNGMSLAGADLQNQVLAGANLQRADLRLADLTGADLRGTDLRGANFRGADLRGADLRDARMYRADLHHALYDRDTYWPAGFDPATSGAENTGRNG